MSLRDEFPQSALDANPMAPESLTLPLGQQFLHIPLASLTERERALLEVLAVIETGQQAQPHNAWSAYLLAQTGPAPQALETLQVYYLRHNGPISADLQDFLSQFLGQRAGLMPVHPTLSALVIDASQTITQVSELADLLPALESDFGLRLQLVVGNGWSRQVQDQWPALIQAELALVESYLPHQGADSYQPFAQVMLWGLMQDEMPQVLQANLKKLIAQTKDGADLIAAMWQTHGNLVQAAQKLFIHRNSLNYKLDKFTQQTGLNLKNLDSLALCHLLQLQG